MTTPVSWLLFLDDDSARPLEAPVPVASASLGHGDRSVPAVGPSAAGTGSAPAGAAGSRLAVPAGPPRREGRPLAWCEVHKIAMAVCMYCEDPILLEPVRLALAEFEPMLREAL